ncbi:MAG: hypothetical protein HQL51_04605 [Magnetococcales bacterium]|nr:hypothetical protein [Magnetococcales bacterium]
MKNMFSFASSLIGFLAVFALAAKPMDAQAGSASSGNKGELNEQVRILEEKMANCKKGRKEIVAIGVMCNGGMKEDKNWEEILQKRIAEVKAKLPSESPTKSSDIAELEEFIAVFSKGKAFPLKDRRALDQWGKAMNTGAATALQYQQIAAEIRSGKSSLPEGEQKKVMQKLFDIPFKSMTDAGYDTTATFANCISVIREIPLSVPDMNISDPEAIAASMILQFTEENAAVWGKLGIIPSDVSRMLSLYQKYGRQRR